MLASRRSVFSENLLARIAVIPDKSTQDSRFILSAFLSESMQREPLTSTRCFEGMTLIELTSFLCVGVLVLSMVFGDWGV